MIKPKLQSIPLWLSVSKIADYSDSLLSDLPEEEKWLIEAKIRARSFEVTSDVAEAYGSLDPRDAKWHFGMARRSLFGLNNALRMCRKRGYLQPDPDIMVAIDAAVEELDLEVESITKAIPKWFKEMTPSSESNEK